MNDSKILLQINDSKEFRVIYPIAPFGVIGLIVITLILIYFQLDDFVNIKIVYFLAFLFGLIVTEIFYFYQNDKLLFYENKLEVLKGGKVKKVYMYDNIKRVNHSKNFMLGAGASARTFYLEVVSIDGVRDRILFSGFIYQKGNIKKSLKVLKECGVEIVDVDNSSLVRKNKN